MLTNRQNLIEALEGRRPERIPFTTYAVFDFPEPGLSELKKLGFCQVQFAGVLRESTDGIEREVSASEWKGHRAETVTLRTPVGEISQTSVNGWVQEYFLKTPQDYRIMEYVVRNTRMQPDCSQFEECERRSGDGGITFVWCRRSPIQTMLVDLAGLENFSWHMAEGSAETEMLFEALLDQFIETCGIVAASPARYIHMLENMTAETWGPAKFAKYHLPVYEKALPILHAGGKKVYAHFDGKLKCLAELVARSAIDGIESFTVPPEGDMQYGEARQFWPDKFIWSNISLGVYRLPDKELRAWVRDAVKQCAPDGRNFALAILEDIPENWREKIPVILEALSK